MGSPEGRLPQLESWSIGSRLTHFRLVTTLVFASTYNTQNPALGTRESHRKRVQSVVRKQAV